MIQRPSQRPSPVPDHLSICVVRDDQPGSTTLEELRARLADPESAKMVDPYILRRLHHVADRLLEDFQPARSRALLFSRSRRGAARQAEVLRQFLAGSGQPPVVGVFHAGLPAEERQELYEQFLAGSIQVLVSTKAFGMGMDIPNIHFLAHLDLPATLEDYLQEIGRAGRDRSMLAQVGFTAERPLTCWLYYSQAEVDRARSFQRKGRLVWRDVSTVFRAVKDFSREVHGRVLPGRLIVPLAAATLAPGAQLDDTRLRLAFHWLEQLERIELGSYFPPFLSFELSKQPPPQGDAPLARVQRLLRQAAKDRDAVQVNSNDLLRASGCADLSGLFQLLQEGERSGGFRLTTSSLVALRLDQDVDERIWCARSSQLPFHVRVLFPIALSLNQQAMAQELEFERGELKERVLRDVQERLKEETCPWLKGKSPDELHRAIDAWKTHQLRRVPSLITPLLRLLRHQKGMRVESSFDAERGVLLTLTRHVGGLSKTLPGLEALCARVMPDLLVMAETREARTLTSWLEALGCTLQELESALGYLGACGLTGGETLLGRSIELVLRSLSEISPGRPVDARVESEFQEQTRLSEYRLAALDVAAHLEPDEQRELFLDFFASGSSQDVQACLKQRLEDSRLRNRWRTEGRLEEVDQILRATREHVLKEKLAALSADQRRAVEHPEGQSLAVQAGPGSGKTHILGLRCAWLLLERNLRPEDLLVVAYNRAVVVEIRSRLVRLFREVGIRGEAERVPVTTLHGLAGRLLGSRARFTEPGELGALFQDVEREHPAWIRAWEQNHWLVRRDGGLHPHDNLLVDRPDPCQPKSTERGVRPPVDLWIPWAARDLLERPGSLTAHEILLDEMQDLTGPRLEFLQSLLTATKASLFAVGDPDQSIYGHERRTLGDPTAPEPLLEALGAFLESMGQPPVRLTLGTNFRSREPVLAEAWSRRGRSGRPPQRAKTPGGPAVSVLPAKPDEPAEVVDALFRLISAPKGKEPVPARIGVLFRTNAELALAWSRLEADERFRNLKGTMGSVRFQTDQTLEQFSRCREWLHLRSLVVTKAPEEPTAEGLTALLKEDAQATREAQAHWDAQILRAARHLIVRLAEGMDTSFQLADLLQAADELASQPDALLQALRLWAETAPASARIKEQEIVLGTIHRAKGLQYDAVLVAPSRMKLDDSAEDLDEERRVAYVACTRAATRLVLLEGPRERAISAGQAFHREGEFPPVVSSLEDVNLGAMVRRGLHADEHDLRSHQTWLHQKLAHGQPLWLEGRNLLADVGGKRQVVGQVSQAYQRRVERHLNRLGHPPETVCEGLRVGGVIRRETSMADLEFSPDPAIQRLGFYWLVVPAGLPIPTSRTAS